MEFHLLRAWFGSWRIPRLFVGVFAIVVLAGGCTSGGAGGGSASPGVTDEAVTVGFVVVDTGSLQERIGFKAVDQGTYEKRVQAIESVVAAVNARGGLGGRTILPKFQRYDATQDTPEYAEARCKEFTQDAQAFAVVLDGQFQNNLRPCYAAARTVMLDITNITQDTTSLEQLAPYLWIPSVPEAGAFERTRLQVLRDAGFFTGSRGVEVVAPDTDVARRLVETIVVPTLTSYGLANATYFVDSSNVGTLSAGGSAAVQDATGKGFDRVMVVGGARILATLFNDPGVGLLDAKYTISSFDNPQFFVDNQETYFSEKLVGMAGLGYIAAYDLRKDPSAPFPSPSRPNEAFCKQTIDAAGAQPPEQFRENYRLMIQYCDSVLVLEAAFKSLPKGSTVDAEAFRTALWNSGSAWTSALGTSSGWVNGSYSGLAGAAGIYFDPACQVQGNTRPGCFRYGTAEIPLA
jgi:hypothetical protein